jgi:type I restriction enzyme S subunit
VKHVSLGEVVRIDRTPATDADCRSLPYVGLEHIEKDTGRFASDYDGSVADMLATQFRFTSRHVLYGKLRPYLNKVALPNFDGVCTTEILPLLPKPEKLDRTYLWAMLLSPKFVEWASSNVSGANLPRLAPSLLAEYPIPLPPLAEQQRIAGLLRRADRLRRLRRYALDVSAGYLQAVFVEMFGDPVRNPMGWERVAIGDVADVQGGLQISQKRETLPITVPYLRVANVFRESIDLTEIKMMRLTKAELARTKLKNGDVLVVEGHGNKDEIGRAAVWNESIEPCVHQNHLIRIRPNRSLKPKYLSHYLNSASGRAYFQNMSNTTSGLNTISTGLVKQCQILRPSAEVQSRFTNVVQQYERLRSQQREALRQAEHLFQALLRRAFQTDLPIGCP